MQYLSVISIPRHDHLHMSMSMCISNGKNYLRSSLYDLTIYPERLRATDLLLSICHIIILNGYIIYHKKECKVCNLHHYLLMNFQHVSNLFAIKLFIKIGMTKTFVLFFLTT